MLSRSPRPLPILSLVWVACTSPETPEEDRTCGGAAPYAASGPYPAAVTTMEVDGVPVEIWYPGTPGSEEGRARDVYDLRDWLEGIVDGISDEGRFPRSRRTRHQSPHRRDPSLLHRSSDDSARGAHPTRDRTCA